MRLRGRLRQQNRLLHRVRSYKERMEGLSDEELAHLTVEFKQRLAAGESLDQLLPEAFAAICEADYRILGKAPYDVQVLGGIALHQGYLAEMNTGEGKTLVATMPLYLNALTGKSTILVTANDYLALRDAEELGQVYRFMGLTVAAGASRKQDRKLTNEIKKEIYQADIVYTTHGTLGFDYLFNNLVTRAEDRFLREFYYVIIDEADSVLLDGAQMPLVISGSPRVQSNLYELADFFVTTLVEGEDYETEEKKVWFTEKGIRYAETFFQIDNFYGEEHFEINRHVTLALRAHALFRQGKDYMISSQGELQLLDEGSGRMMPGVKLRGGQHQALEAKERTKISQENRSVASITYQNLFLLFPKMAGMSGTLADAREELMDVYQKKVLVIPPNRPMRRKDLPDLYYRDADDQFQAAIGEALRLHETGRPVLIVVTTIAQTELISKALVREKIPHNVLNANNAFWEAEIIKEAGRRGAVTVATSMAGRGTDIMLGEGVGDLGGLAVIGVGRMVNVRQERQARGRAGRQGDPGTSRFFVALTDEVVLRNQPLKFLNKYIEKQKRISMGRVKRIIDKSQSLGEEYAVMARKRGVVYDQILQRQRQLVYGARNQLLDGESLPIGNLMKAARENIEEFLHSQKTVDSRLLGGYILDHISYRLDEEITDMSLNNAGAMETYLLKKVMEGLEEQKKRLGSKAAMNQFVRMAVLSAIDDAWVEQVDYLQQLQAAVSGRASAQRNLVYEYHKEALKSFRKMEKTIRREMIRNILLSAVYSDAEGRLHILFP